MTNYCRFLLCHKLKFINPIILMICIWLHILGTCVHPYARFTHSHDALRMPFVAHS